MAGKNHDGGIEGDVCPRLGKSGPGKKKRDGSFTIYFRIVLQHSFNIFYLP